MTTRYPIRYEEEVLSKHGIEWVESLVIEESRYERDGQEPYKHELAGIALEAILEYHWDFIIVRDNVQYFSNYYDIEDKDYFECFNKAVGEIWK